MESSRREAPSPLLPAAPSAGLLGPRCRALASAELARFPRFLNRSRLCSLVDDISGTLPASVLVGPMGSSLQSFPLPPPPPPHAPGQLRFGSTALAFPSGLWGFAW